MAVLSKEDIKKIDGLAEDAMDYLDNCQHKMTLIKSILEHYENAEPEVDMCTWSGLRLMVNDWLSETELARNNMDRIGLVTVHAR